MMGFRARRIFSPRLYRWPFIPHQSQSSTVFRFIQLAAASSRQSGPRDSQTESAAPFGNTLLRALAGAACAHIFGYWQGDPWSAAAEDLSSRCGFDSAIPSELLVELRVAVGSERVVLDEGVTDAHSNIWNSEWNWYQKMGRKPDAVVYPRSLNEAAAVVHACQDHGVAISNGGRGTSTNSSVGLEPGISIDMSFVPVQKGRRSIAQKSSKDGAFMVEKTLQSTDVPLHRLDILRIEKEAVIHASKHHLLETLTQQLDPDAAKELRTLFLRVDSTIRAWYKNLFEEMLHLYRTFDPVNAGESLEDLECTSEQLQRREIRFLRLLFYVMNKSNFKMVSDAEAEVALAGEYLLSLPIAIDESKLDDTLMTRFFDKHPMEHKPTFSDKYIIFRRGVGIDQVTDHFWMQKLDLLLESLWATLLWCLCLRKRKSWEPIVHDTRGPGDSKAEKDAMSIERVHLEGMRLSAGFFTSLTTIQEPTFEHMIVIYRPVAKEEEGVERSIVIKHFRDIPMADMEIVLPEMKVPGLTKRDTLSFGVTLLGGVVAIGTAAKAGLSYSVMGAILAVVGSYCMKLYLAWNASMDTYRAMIQQIMYDKQLDSGNGSLLHICDDVLQQEIKEAMVAYFVLLTQGNATKEDLDERCELFMESTFGENVQFDVEDAVDKLLRLGIASEAGEGRLKHVALGQAVKAIGTTTDEIFGSTDLIELIELIETASDSGAPHCRSSSDSNWGPQSKPPLQATPSGKLNIK